MVDITDIDDGSAPAETATPAKIESTKAVALKHQRGEGSAPRITASGRGAVADQILELAFANGVRVREDSNLVEILSELEIDSPIPLEAYAAVAEILAYVYKADSGYSSLKGKS